MRADHDRILDMIEMCDLLLQHASDPSRLAEDPVIQAAAQRWIEVLGEVPRLRTQLYPIAESLAESEHELP